MIEAVSPKKRAGEKLRQLIQANYTSQDEFAYEFGCDIRTVNRYINEGINKVDVIQELAEYFGVGFEEFFIY